MARWKGYKRIEIFDDEETSQELEDNAIADDEEIVVERDWNVFYIICHSHSCTFLVSFVCVLKEKALITWLKFSLTNCEQSLWLKFSD